MKAPGIVIGIALSAVLIGSIHAQQPGPGRPEPEYRCGKDPYVVEKCYAVRGRLLINAGSRVDFYPFNSRQIMGVMYPALKRFGDKSGFETPLPENVYNALEDCFDVVADFVICPLTHYVPPERQYICIDSATRIRRVPVTGKSFCNKPEQKPNTEKSN
jgi:hypothetical protein